MYGLRVRVQQADAWAGMFRAVGANPVAVPTDRVYVHLQSGLIDAAEHNWPSYVSQRHYQVAPYFSMTGHSMAPAVLVFSKRVWDTLKPDEQAIIRSAAKESVPFMRRLWDDYEAAGRRTVEAAGWRHRDRCRQEGIRRQAGAALLDRRRQRSNALPGAPHPGRRSAGADPERPKD